MFRCPQWKSHTAAILLQYVSLIKAASAAKISCDVGGVLQVSQHDSDVCTALWVHRPRRGRANDFWTCACPRKARWMGPPLVRGLGTPPEERQGVPLWDRAQVGRPGLLRDEPDGWGFPQGLAGEAEEQASSHWLKPYPTPYLTPYETPYEEPDVEWLQIARWPFVMAGEIYSECPLEGCYRPSQYHSFFPLLSFRLPNSCEDE